MPLNYKYCRKEEKHMKSRREFLQSIFISFGLLSAGKLKAFAGSDDGEAMGYNARKFRNIFCQFNNEQLRQAIEQCAKEMDCTVSYGGEGGIDITAVDSFVKIVDRNIVGRNVWNKYVEYIDSAGGNNPCIIVDDISDWSLPIYQYTGQLSLKDPGAVKKVVQTIKQMRKTLNKNIPDLFAKQGMESSSNTVYSSTFGWPRTILCLTDNSRLNQEVKKYAKVIGYSFLDTIPEPVMVIDSYRDITIVDKSIFSTRFWESYTFLQNMTSEDSVTTLLITVGAVEPPELKRGKHLIIKAFPVIFSMDDIIETIREFVHSVRESLKSSPTECFD